MTADAPAPPPPDTKDWTWVVEQPCPECGFEAGEVAREDVAGMLRAVAVRFASLLTDEPEDAVRRRPAETTWSALEYGCHVRDVCWLYLERLELMLEQDGPHYANWDQDETAIEQRYDLQHPSVVAGELIDAANALADRFDAVEGEAWDRTGFRSDGAAFTVETFARYFLHDPVHHEWDVRQGLAG